MMAVTVAISMTACGKNAVNTTETAAENSETTKEAVLEKTQETEMENTENKEESSIGKEENVEEEDVVIEGIIESSGSEATEFAANLKAGWNLGNTLDAWEKKGPASNPDSLSSETCWGNPATTKEMIDTIKDAGFTTVRIPVTYHNHITVETGEDGKDHIVISDAWIARVKEVVDYCIDDGLFVIINVHHDNEPEGQYGYIPDYENKEQAIWYITEIWETVAPVFKDYDEHLIFESMNEPRLTNDPANEWWMNESEHCLEAVDVINEINQEFVNVIRKTGGNNVNRYLMVPGYAASISGTDTTLFKVPEDPASHKIMVALHAYVPYDFALNPSEDVVTFNDTVGANEINSLLRKMQERYLKKGIPVVIGEFGARNKKDNLEERIKYYNTYVGACASFGIPCCVWDNGIYKSGDELFALLNRKEGGFYYPEIVDAIVNSYN